MFVDVIVPVSVPKLYTYGVPIELQDQVEIGKRVEVEFGKRRRYSGVVYSIHQQKPDVYEPKPIISVIDEEALITSNQLAFWDWISHYYMSTMGDVMTAAMPTALRLSSESKIQLVFEGDINEIELNDDEFLIIEALSSQSELSIEDAQIILGTKQVFPILKNLIDQRIIRVKEELKSKYKPKTEDYFRLKVDYQQEAALHQLLDSLNRAPKQQDALLTFLSLSKNQPVWVSKKEWLNEKNISTATLNALLKRDIFDHESRPVNQIVAYQIGDFNSQLSVEQQQAFTEIKESFAENKACLLHGITGSGKTHIYIKLIEEQIAQNKQVLYLLPEIALTSQIITRLTKHFGDQIGVYHSKYSDSERVEVWNNTLNGNYKIIVGARSSLFLPFKNLGLIIIDEEHDTSYKQRDPAPRYHARDAALWLANYCNAQCLMGTATPSFESYFNAEQGKYTLVTLTNRFGQSQLPTIEIVNLNKQYIPGDTYKKFSKRLIDELRTCLETGKQAILFRNRRGYSSILQCTACGHSITCVNCDVSLTYHKYRDKLECHYCGYKEDVPHRCPACGHNELEFYGLGTQRVEEELNVFFPKARFARMDLDTTRSKYGHQQIIERFERKEIDILVGTQMVTKGLDFEDVGLVCILNADSMLQFPDFRAEEHALQLFEQVSGRAGRQQDQGLVIVQVRNDNNPVLPYLQNHDYVGFYHHALPERLEFHYPPYYRQIKVTCKHKDWKTCYQGALALSQALRQYKDQIVKGPSEPLVSKVNNWYIQEVYITLEKNATIINQAKTYLQNCIDHVQKQPGLSSVRINVDVDPQ